MEAHSESELAPVSSADMGWTHEAGSVEVVSSGERSSFWKDHGLGLRQTCVLVFLPLCLTLCELLQSRD